MSWIKRALRNWLNSSNEITISEDRPYAAPHNNMGETYASVQLFKAMNGTILVLFAAAPQSKNLGASIRANNPTMYILKEGENIQEAVATLLVKARLDSM